MAYINPPENTESLKTFKKRLYGVLHAMTTVECRPPDLRVTQEHPSIPWEKVWRNLHHASISERLKSTWYIVIHEIVPTNERLAAIRLADTDRCTLCGKLDSLSRRITECGEGHIIWNWTRARIAALLRMDPRQIPAEWTLRPTFHFWPPQKHAAMIWIIAHQVAYRMQTQKRLSLLDFTDFLRRTRWKAYNQTARRHTAGNYLDVLKGPIPQVGKYNTNAESRRKHPQRRQTGGRGHHPLAPRQRKETKRSHLLRHERESRTTDLKTPRTQKQEPSKHM